jgi:hypothetical protein
MAIEVDKAANRTAAVKKEDRMVVGLVAARWRAPLKNPSVVKIEHRLFFVHPLHSETRPWLDLEMNNQAHKGISPEWRLLKASTHHSF